MVEIRCIFFKFILFVCIFISVLSLPADQRTEPCAIDILFVLDASSSVQGEFEKMKEFVVELGKVLVISPNGHRVALLEFSGLSVKWPKYEFGFVQTTDEFVEVLKKIPDLRGTTYAGKALSTAYDMLRQRTATVKTLVIVVTDGFSFDDVAAQSDQIHKLNNVVTFAAGVPKDVNMDVLVQIAGDEQRVVTNPDVLSKAKGLLSQYLFKCDVPFTRAPVITTRQTTLRPTTSATTQSTTTVTASFISGCELDVLLVVDFSGSVRSSFEEYIALCEQLVQKLKVGKFFTRVSMLQFASKARTEVTFPFNKTFDKDGVLKQIKGAEYSGGTTNMEAALELALTSFDVDDGARPGLAKQIAIVFSDGFSQHDPEEGAKKLRNKGVTLYASTANDQSPYNSEQLQIVTGEEKRVFIGQNSFLKLVDEISRMSNSCSRSSKF